MVVDRLLDSTWRRRAPSAVDRAVANVVLYRLMRLARDPSAGAQVRAIASLSLAAPDRDWAKKKSNDPGVSAHLHFGREQIRRFRSEPGRAPPPPPGIMPAGSPIGAQGPIGCGG